MNDYPHYLNEGLSTFFYAGSDGTREQCDKWIMEAYEAPQRLEVDHTVDPAQADE